MRPLYIAAPRWRAVSLRYGDWKLIKANSDGNEVLELYNIRQDPSESLDQILQKPQLANQMIELLEASAAKDNELVIGEPTL
jgi:arylsulfatase A-like enzyme